MSALGHKRTFAAQKGRSALPPKADMCGATRDVRFVPIADMTATSELSHYAVDQEIVVLRITTYWGSCGCNHQYRCL